MAFACEPRPFAHPADGAYYLPRITEEVARKHLGGAREVGEPVRGGDPRGRARV